MNILRESLLDFVSSNTPNIYFKPCVIYPVFVDPLFKVKTESFTTSIDLALSDRMVHLDGINTSLRPGDILINSEGLCFTSSGEWVNHGDLYAVPQRFVAGELVEALSEAGIDLKDYFK